jgi:ketosteroid isomerase-like protein
MGLNMTISAEPTSTRRAEENLQVAKRLLASLLSADRDQAIGLINENFEMLLPMSVSPRPICGIGAFGKYVEAATKVFVDGAAFEEINAVSLRDTVVLEVKVIGRAKSGRQYENLYVHWFELEAGKVSRWREHVDTKRAMELLS